MIKTFLKKIIAKVGRSNCKFSFTNTIFLGEKMKGGLGKIRRISWCFERERERGFRNGLNDRNAPKCIEI